MNVIFDPAFLALVAVIAATTWFASAARGRGAGRLAAVGAVIVFSGGLVASLGAAHTIAVIGRALRRPSFVYDFRLYSLVLFGACQIAGGLRLLSTSWNVARGDVRAWRAALAVTTLLLVVNLPLVPIKGFAGATSLPLMVALITLMVTGRRFVPHVGAETVTIPEITREHASSAT